MKRSRLGILFALATFLLCTVVLSVAQQNVQITKGPSVEQSTPNSAVVAWSTNVNASTILKYGTDANNLNQTAQAPWGGLTHRVHINNLQPNTTYYMQVESTQGSGTGTAAVSGVSQFQTANGPASMNPTAANSAPAYNPSTFKLMAGPIPQQVTSNSANIWWETNEPLNGAIIKYGTSPSAMNQTVPAQTSNGISNTVHLTNLQPGTLYYVSIWRPDGQQAAMGSFTTPANQQAQNVNVTNGPVIQNLASNQAVIAWQTSVPASSIVKYGTSAQALNQTAQSQWTSGTHTVTLNNLQPNTEYWFQVQSAQAQGTGTSTQTGAFPFWTPAPGQAAYNIPPQF